MSTTDARGAPRDATASAALAADRLRLADAVRTLVGVTATGDLDADALAGFAGEAERLAAALTAAVRGRIPRGQPDTTGPPADFFPASPISGVANPMAPPVHMEVVTGPDGVREIRGTATFGLAYEGPPTCVHGGVIAEVFDEVLGAANMVAGNPGMTAGLTVRYRKPTPLQTELRLEARCLGRDGRKIRTVATIHHGDVLTAEAEGLFIEVGPTKFLAIAEENTADADPEMLAAIRAEALRAGPVAPDGDSRDPSVG